jgi:hypothetical protein
MGIFSGTRLAISPAIIFLLLDVEEILEKREGEAYTLTTREKSILSHTIDFLETAEKGREIVQRNTGTLVADVASVQHYSYISEALPSTYPRQLEEAIQASKTVLQRILDGTFVGKEEGPETRRFFEMLSDLAFNQFSSLRQ